MRSIQSIRRRLLSWLNLFDEADLEVDPKTNIVGVRIPGLLKEDNTPNPKGNVMALVAVNDIDSIMDALRNPRRPTAAEIVHASLGFTDTEISFKVTDDSGARTIRVPKEDWASFLDSFEEKLYHAAGVLQEYAEQGEPTTDE